MIGVGDYAHVLDLSTPSHDRILMAHTLAGLGFEVSVLDMDAPSRNQMMDAIDAFGRTLDPGDVALVYFSGHGVERAGLNYLVPAPATSPAEGREAHELVGLDYITDALTTRNIALALLVLDACRTDPFVGAGEDMRFDPSSPASADAFALVGPASEPGPPRAGLAVTGSPPGVLIGYAAAPGRPAYSLMRDDAPVLGSLYTRTLVAQLGRPGKFIYQDLNDTSRTLSELTGHRQNPWTSAFAPPDLQLRPDARQRAEEETVWIRTVKGLTPAREDRLLATYLAFNPASGFAGTARARLTELRAPAFLDALRGPADQVSASRDLSYRFARGLESLTIEEGQMSAAFVATDRLALFGWDPQRNRSREIGAIAAGEAVTLVDSLQPGEPPRVLRQNGQVGYILAALPRRSRTVATSSMQFAGPEDLGDAVNPQLPLGATGELPGGAEIRVAVGSPTGVPGGRGRQIAYARALAIREGLVAQGAPLDAIRLTVGDTDLAGDTARLSLNLLEEP